MSEIYVIDEAGHVPDKEKMKKMRNRENKEIERIFNTFRDMVYKQLIWCRK